MSLINKVKEDQVKARLAKDPNATLLTTLLGEAAKIGKDAGNRETTDEEVVAVVKKFIKGINDTMEFLGDKNPKATQVCLDEKRVLEVYLPRQMTKEQIKGALLTIFGSMEGQKKGILMTALKQNFAGQYDGKEAAAAVDELLKS